MINSNLGLILGKAKFAGFQGWKSQFLSWHFLQYANDLIALWIDAIMFYEFSDYYTQSLYCHFRNISNFMFSIRSTYCQNTKLPYYLGNILKNTSESGSKKLIVLENCSRINYTTNESLSTQYVLGLLSQFH